MPNPLAPLLAAAAALHVLPTAPAQDFATLHGNARRDARVDVVGPIEPTLDWAATSPSIIAWMPYVSGGVVYVVRETGFPQAGGPANDALVALDLATGTTLWTTTLPFGGDPATEFIAWIAGVDRGRVYASRSQNQRPGPIRALDASTGALLWTSTAVTEAFAYDGAVVTPDGDLVVGDHQRVVRIDGATGGTVWEVARSCPVSGSCGVAIAGSAVYFDQPALGGNSLGKLDLTTGTVLYESPTMPGVTDQNTPFVGPDGTVYFARTQNNATVDFLYAFDDTGTAFVQRWAVPVRWTVNHGHAVASDGSIYTFNANEEFVRLDPQTGAEIGNAGVLMPLGSPSASPRTVVDGDGTVYVSNGWASTPATDGRLWAFSADLGTQHFVLQLDRPNQGGPALAGMGSLVVADRASVRSYRAPSIGTSYCGPAVPNSTGASATLTARGSLDPDGADVVLSASALPPNQFALLLTSRTQGLVPNVGGGQGTLCLGGTIGRFNTLVRPSGALGWVEVRVDPASLPEGGVVGPALSGQTWNFQTWFRDSVGGAATSNLTDAVAVTFV